MSGVFVSFTSADKKTKDDLIAVLHKELGPEERIWDHEKDCVSNYSEECVTAIEETAFRGRNITAMTIPGTIRTVSEGCFQNCELLEAVTVGEGIVRIGKNAFYGCSKLKELYLPSSLSSFATHAFSGCPSLTDVYFEVSVKKWETMTQSVDLTDAGFTVHCKDGMIEPGGAVTRY